MEYWTPKGEGTALELSPILEPLAAYKDQMLVFSGIKASWNYIHAGASGSFLTGTPRGGRTRSKSSPTCPSISCSAGISRRRRNSRSLEMSMDLPANAGACTGNLSCAYLDTLSWRSPTQPLPMEWNPRTVFEKLFGDSGSTDRAAREKRSISTRAFWIPSTASWRASSRSSAPRIRPRWTNTPTPFATSSAASKWPSGRAPSSCLLSNSLWAPRRCSKITWR